MKKVLIGVVLALGAIAAGAADNGVVTLPSKYSVAETIERLESAAKAENFQILGRVDFQPLAVAAKGEIRPTQLLFFGRGGILPPLIPVAPTAALDLPLKALAWQDAAGKVWLTFNTGEFLQARHDVKGVDPELFKRLTAATTSLARKATE
jgi:uncharacterized protein (DUF302 family)